jgi:hypothetical protein
MIPRWQAADVLRKGKKWIDEHGRRRAHRQRDRLVPWCAAYAAGPAAADHTGIYAWRDRHVDQANESA